jgi:hypothetical protein
MKFISVSNSTDALAKALTKDIKKHIKKGDKVFIAIHSNQCGHCLEMMPEWNKMKSLSSMKNKNTHDIVVVDIEKDYLPELDDVINQDSIQGYPTLRYIEGNKMEEYEKCNDISTKDRSLSSFVEWINSKSFALKKIKSKGKNPLLTTGTYGKSGGKRKTHRRRHKTNKRKTKRRKTNKRK